MQKISILALLLIANYSFSQKTGNMLLLNASNYRIKGICNGVRLDTLSSSFITVNIIVNNDEKIQTGTYKIDYGQGDTRAPFNDLRDENHNYIQFASLAVLLNFMDYNGWIYQNTVVNQKIYPNYGGTGSTSDETEKLIFYKAKE